MNFTCFCFQALFALSSMLRHFPYAQQQFLKLGGLHVLRNLFTEKGMEALYVRIVTLLYDLIMEKVRGALMLQRDCMKMGVPSSCKLQLCVAVM